MKHLDQASYTWQKRQMMVHISLSAALFLSLYPYQLGWQIYAPDFLGLICLYWLAGKQRTLGYWQIFLYGIFFDLLHFNFIGAESIGLLLLTFVFLRYQVLFQFLPLVGQFAAVLLLLMLKRFCILWILAVTGELPSFGSYFYAPMISTVLWALVRRLPLANDRRLRK